MGTFNVNSIYGKQLAAGMGLTPDQAVATYPNMFYYGEPPRIEGTTYNADGTSQPFVTHITPEQNNAINEQIAAAHGLTPAQQAYADKHPDLYKNYMNQMNQNINIQPQVTPVVANQTAPQPAENSTPMNFISNNTYTPPEYTYNYGYNYYNPYAMYMNNPIQPVGGYVPYSPYTNMGQYPYMPASYNPYGSYGHANFDPIQAQRDCDMNYINMRDYTMPKQPMMDPMLESYYALQEAKNKSTTGIVNATHDTMAMPINTCGLAPTYITNPTQAVNYIPDVSCYVPPKVYYDVNMWYPDVYNPYGYQISRYIEPQGGINLFNAFKQPNPHYEEECKKYQNILCMLHNVAYPDDPITVEDNYAPYTIPQSHEVEGIDQDYIEAAAFIARSKYFLPYNYYLEKYKMCCNVIQQQYRAIIPPDISAEDFAAQAGLLLLDIRHRETAEINKKYMEEHNITTPTVSPSFLQHMAPAMSLAAAMADSLTDSKISAKYVNELLDITTPGVSTEVIDGKSRLNVMIPESLRKSFEDKKNKFWDVCASQ